MSETLYNGIILPEEWPPRGRDPASRAVKPVPYLESPPAVIPIDIGRQLFVDDFLIENTTLKRTFHQPVKHPGNPVFFPETPWEKTALPCATPKSGGIWWDAVENKFLMWYEAGWLGQLAFATSRDGLQWERPDLDIVPGTNLLLPGFQPDSTTVFPDPHTHDPLQRFKLFLRPPDGPLGSVIPAYSMVSADGLHWSDPVESICPGDRSTIFYNPFRRKWVYSLRTLEAGRTRRYREHDDFLTGAGWQADEPVFWESADELDAPDPELGIEPQLYNLDAIAYESLMLGMFQIHRGPSNEDCQKTGIPKITDLTLAFSRDGFHWHRPVRTPFLAGTGRPRSWERGYVQSVGGVCVVRENELWFYYLGFEGDQTILDSDWKKNGMYARGSTGLARLRRDGFASMDADATGGDLLTRPVTFLGTRLFLNASCPRGEIRAEVCDEAGNPIGPFSLASSIPFAGDSTCALMRWRDTKDLGPLHAQRVRFRFHIREGALFSFWTSADSSGASGTP